MGTGRLALVGTLIQIQKYGLWVTGLHLGVKCLNRLSFGIVGGIRTVDIGAGTPPMDAKTLQQLSHPCHTLDPPSLTGFQDEC